MLKTIAFEDKHYLWANIDAGDRFFWEYTNGAAKDSSQILFDYKYFSWDIWKTIMPIQVGKSIDSNFNRQFDVEYHISLNSQFYLEARNKKGYIFTLSVAGQISELNRFLQDNTAFHKVENKYKIDSFLMLLQEACGKNMFEKFPFGGFSPFSSFSAFADTPKKEVDTLKLKIKGFDYVNQTVYYFDSIVSVPYTPLKEVEFYYNRIYSHYVYNIDSLLIMREYLSANSPTFLYYKERANKDLPWHNYFLAYYLDYADDGRPTISKVDIIIPKRMYYYVCYPSGWCDDIGPSPYSLHINEKRIEPQQVNDDYRPSK